MTGRIRLLFVVFNDVLYQVLLDDNKIVFEMYYNNKLKELEANEIQRIVAFTICETSVIVLKDNPLSKRIIKLLDPEDIFYKMLEKKEKITECRSLLSVLISELDDLNEKFMEALKYES